MKVRHVYGALVRGAPEGITRNVHGLVDALRRTGSHVGLDASPVQLEALNRLSTHAATARRTRRLAWAAAAEPGVDLVHVHVNIATMGIALRGLAPRPRILLHVWNPVYAGDATAARGVRRRWVHRLFNGPSGAMRGLRSAPEVVVSSHYQSDQLRSLGYGGNLHVVPNGVDTNEFHPSAPEARATARDAFGARGDPTLVYYGHLSPWKGVDVALRGFAHLRKEHPRSELLLAHTSYGGRREEYARLAARLGIADAIRWSGPTHVPSLLAAADIAIVPPIAPVGTACHPNVLLESLAAGLPVAASRVGSIPEVVDHGANGVLFEPGDPADLGANLALLAEDARLRRRLGDAARRDAVARFDWARVARQMAAVYAEPPGARARPGSAAPDPLPEIRKVAT